jgi:hypothetical protein
VASIHTHELWEVLREAAEYPAEVTTPGTRLRWRNLREWLICAEEIAYRRSRLCSSANHRATEAHLRVLPRGYIEQETDQVVLRAALAHFTEWQRKSLPRGSRAGHPVARAIVLLNNQIARCAA